MKLSKLTGDYTNFGGVTDKYQLIAVGGETEFTLIFVDGAEEVYVNGARLLKGPGLDYTTTSGLILLSSPLVENDELLLVGRSATNEIPYTRASGETTVLVDGQDIVYLQSVSMDSAEVYVSGLLVDKGRLKSPSDYVVIDEGTIQLTGTYPAGTVIEVVQSARLSWIDPDTMIVNDGNISKSLSARFRDTQESRDYFIQSSGLQLQEISAGTTLDKWSITDPTGIPTLDTEGNYPVLKVGSSYWNPPDTDTHVVYTISSWVIVGSALQVSVVDPAGNPSVLPYEGRVLTNYNVANADAIKAHDYASSTIGGTVKARILGTTLYLTTNGSAA